MVHFGVTLDSLSSFCKNFDTVGSLLDEVKKYMDKGSVKNDKVVIDNDSDIIEVEVNNVTPTLETIKNMISIV